MIKDHISFFTRIPLRKMYDLEKIGNSQYLFPFVGLGIGLLMYLVASVLIYLDVPSSVGAAALLASLYLFIGILHLDGLSDFADGLYKSGSKTEKIDAMLDPSLGVAGALSALLALFFVFSQFEALLSNQYTIQPFLTQLTGVNIPNYSIFAALITSEIASKLSMNTASYFSKPMERSAIREFLRKMNLKEYLFSLTASTIIAGILNPILILLLFFSQIIPLYLIKLSKENFGGSCGDLLGASGEITRITVMMTILLL